MRNRPSSSTPNVAIVADWIDEVGGAERVLVELLDLFPEAPVYTSVIDRRRIPAVLRNRTIHTSYLQALPGSRRHRQAFLPLMPLAFEQFDLSAFDVVVTTSSACSKGVLTGSNTANICYCYTPPRYLWDLYHDHVGRHPARILIAPVAQRLRQWDRMAADRVDRFIAISHEVSGRIRKNYRRDSEIIYPPVDVDRFSTKAVASEDYFLVVSRLVPYKRIDLAVQAANQAGVRLLVVGDGRDRRRLESMAGSTVTFLGRRPDEEVTELYRRCRAFLFPGFEDFGITAVEAQAAGRPVIAFGRGGACETVVDGATGILFDEQTVESLASELGSFRSDQFDPAVCRANAERFDRKVFRDRIKKVVFERAATTPTAELGRIGSARLRETA